MPLVADPATASLPIYPPIPSATNTSTPPVLILSVCDSPDRAWPLVSSAQRNGHDITVLTPPAGYKMRWPDKLLPKVTLPLAYIRQSVREPHQLVALVDAFDVLVTASPTEMAERYHKEAGGDGAIFFNAERWCYPPTRSYCRHAAKQNACGGAARRYLNSGVLVGEARGVLALLEAIEARLRGRSGSSSRLLASGEQPLYQDLALNNPRIRLDCRGLLTAACDGASPRDPSVVGVRTAPLMHFDGPCHWERGVGPSSFSRQLGRSLDPTTLASWRAWRRLCSPRKSKAVSSSSASNATTSRPSACDGGWRAVAEAGLLPGSAGQLPRHPGHPIAKRRSGSLSAGAAPQIKPARANTCRHYCPSNGAQHCSRVDCSTCQACRPTGTTGHRKGVR